MTKDFADHRSCQCYFCTTCYVTLNCCHNIISFMLSHIASPDFSWYLIIVFHCHYDIWYMISVIVCVVLHCFLRFCFVDFFILQSWLTALHCCFKRPTVTDREIQQENWKTHREVVGEDNKEKTHCTQPTLTKAHIETMKEWQLSDGRERKQLAKRRKKRSNTDKNKNRFELFTHASERLILLYKNCATFCC